MDVQKIALVGAGFAGLSTGKLLRDFGYDVTIFEKEADVGGVWCTSRRYPGLKTQNPRDTYALSDFPMPRDYPEWPSGEQMQAYFELYVKEFHLSKQLELNCTVLDASLNDSETEWTLTLCPTGDEANTRQETFDYLIICNGIFSIPAIPHFDGVEDWEKAGGAIMHTCQFNDLEVARGKDVLIIGYGKSSCDAAMAASTLSRSTTVVARNLLWKLPSILGGVLNYKHLMLTRMGEGLFEYIDVKGFDKFLHGVGKPLRNAMLGTVQKVIEAQLKLKDLGLHPGKPLETIARSTVSLATDGFYSAVKDGTISVKKHMQVTALRPGEAELSNGESVPAQVIVAGTGWHQRVPFFKPELMAKVTDERGNFRLYNSMLPVDVPRLAFNGYNSSFFSQLNCEVGAFWILEYLKGAIGLPSKDDRNADIDRRLAWMEARTDGKHSKGTNIIPFSIHHIDELLNEIDLNLSAATRFGQWFAAINAKQYAVIYKQLAQRHKGKAA
jgi:cation diffusion facilitator CzcD-associated flavoprotein CzcO